MTIALENLKVLAERATAGTWQAGISGVSRVYGPDKSGPKSGMIADFVRYQDKEYVAAANPETVLALIAQITQLQSELAALKAQGTFNDGVLAAMEKAYRFAHKPTGNLLREMSLLKRPTSREQIQGEVGKEFPAKGEGE